MQKNHKQRIIEPAVHAALSKIISIKLEREVEREVQSITKGLVNRLNLQPNGQELLGLIGAYNDKNNIEAIYSWILLFKKTDQFREIIDYKDEQHVISRLALKIKSEIEEMYY